jgi:ADP-ribose pyrophosphatase
MTLDSRDALARGRRLLSCRRFDVVAVEERLADGGRRDREIVVHPGSVVVVPILEPGEGAAGRRVCLIENQRLSVGRPLLELPAGTLDVQGEAPADAAARELAEETGWRAARVEPLGGLWMSPGILRERMHLFVATGLSPGEQALEAGERIVPRVIDWQEAIAMCLDGRIDDAKSVAAILLTDRLLAVGGIDGAG